MNNYKPKNIFLKQKYFNSFYDLFFIRQYNLYLKKEIFIELLPLFYEYAYIWQLNL